jgi:sRNA-binding protein
MPLAIGIHKQLYPVAERMQTSRRALRGFLSRWTSSSSYQGALAQPGASRFNLDGSPAGAVSQKHGDRARQLTTSD